MAMTHLWRGTAGEPDLVAAKGAPEAMMHLCRLSQAEQAPLIQAAEQMAEQGLRGHRRGAGGASGAPGLARLPNRI